MIHYFVIGQTGSMISSTDFAKNQKAFDFSLKFNALMGSEAQIVVYYIHHTGEVVYDKETITFDKIYSNKVKFTL